MKGKTLDDLAEITDYKSDEFSDLISKIKQASKTMQANSWNIFILEEILQIDRTIIREISKKRFPRELQLMERDNTRNINKFIR